MDDQNNFTVYVECVRAIITGIIFLYLLWVDRKEDFREWDGWLYLLNGFFLLTFATTIDITDNFEYLERFIIIGPTIVESFLEKIIGYLLGSVFLAIGFFKFLPIISNLRRETIARKKAEEFTKSILSSVDEGFIVIDSRYNIISANNAFLKRANMNSEEAIGKKCYEVSHLTENPCYEEGEECAVKNTFITGKPHTALHKHFQNDGNTYYVEIKSYPLTIKNGEVKTVIEVLNDVTEKRNLEEQLLHAQKLEAVGQLAGGIAHDFNNIITGIIGYGKLIKSGRKSKADGQKYAGHIISAAEKGASLTKSLLIFSRKGVLETLPISLNDIVSGMSDLLSMVVSKKVKLEIELLDDDIVVMADKGQIEQVLMNLVTNANDAMPKGGKIKIKTAVANLGETFIKAHNLGPADRYAFLTVSDEGTGIDEETRRKIFEPFFTTKPVGKGTGLGLSMAYGIIKEHKGYIKVESSPGEGTKFYIYLPESDQIPLKPESETYVGISGSNETILLAEDDEHIRKLMCSYLNEFGYNVLEALDGNDAIKLFKDNKERVSIAIVDYMMPGKTGNEVCKEIRKMKSDVNILLISGYANDVLDGIKTQITDVEILHKPVSPEKLILKINDMLKRRVGNSSDSKSSIDLS